LVATASLIVIRQVTPLSYRLGRHRKP